MAQSFYDLLNSDFFGILLIIWILVDIAWVVRWKALFSRIGTLINKPWIFIKDNMPHDPPLYPRVFLEQLAGTNRNNIQEVSKSNSSMHRWIAAQREAVFDEAHPLRTFGHVIFLSFFIFFLLADAISVANTLSVLQIITDELPPLFERFDLAVLGGALLSAIVGVWMFIEVQGDNSEFLDTRQYSEAQRRIVRGISLLVAIFSVFVMIAFALNRLVVIGELQSGPTLDIILSAVLFGLVPINSALGAAIVFPEATKGVLVVIFLVSFILTSLLPLVTFAIDVIWRFLFIIIDFSVWAFVTPVLAIPFGIMAIIRALSGK